MNITEYFCNHRDPEIAKFAINITTSESSLSDNWAEIHKMQTLKEIDDLKRAIIQSLHYLKLKTVIKLMRDNAKKMREAALPDFDHTEYIEEFMNLQKIKIELCKELGITII